MRMNAVLSNPKHPEYGQFTVPLPIPHNQYDGIMEALNAMDMGDPLARDCQMDEILGEYPILKRLEGKPVNIDELDYLAKRLDSFCYAQEGAQFQGAAVSYDYSDMTDLINLTFSCQQVTVITDFSDLEQVGRDHYMVLNGGCASKEELDALDGYETALLLIDEGNGVITPYGVAHMDFFSSDMRYVKSLNGISEMKQYQLREMLKKLYSIYSVKNHRNLLVAPDSFAYLFEDSDLENRTKSGFILLAKDLKNKYGIPILIVRPKAMLTKNYVNVPPEIEQEFLAAFGNYATPLGFVSDRVEASRNPSRGSDIRIRNHGKIYSVQMGELWENHFANYYFWNEPRHAYYFP